MTDEASPGDSPSSTRSWTREVPPEYPDHLAAALMAEELLNGVDLRKLRHSPLARTAVQKARTAATAAAAELLRLHER